MIDIHSHIIFGVDDGAKDVETSIAMIKNATQNNINNIFLTSHYIDDAYRVAPTEYQKRFDEIVSKVEKEKIEVSLYIGNEVMIFPNLVEDLKAGKVFTLNNSKYVLIELPIAEELLYVEDILFRLKEAGYIPIIAHPERYTYVQSNFKYAEKLVENGALLQMNIASVVGLYGLKAEKTAKRLLKNKLIHFLGSDAHSVHRIYDAYKQAMGKIKKICDNKYFELITEVNSKKIINNETLKSGNSSQKGVGRRWIWKK